MKTDSLDRRSLLAAAGGAVAAAGALGSVPALASEGPSPEFREYLRRLDAHLDICGLEEPAFGTPEAALHDAACDVAGEARYQAWLPICARQVRTEQDFKELALVVRHELWDQLPDGTWHQHSQNDELEEKLQAALIQRIEGGANV